jgi:ribosome-binding factor A
MSEVRIERYRQEVLHAVSDILLNRTEDPRLRQVMATRVEVSRDLTHATVYVSALGDERTQEESLRALIRAGSFVRSELARRLRVRRVPELTFRADLGIQYSLRLQQILSELGLHEADPGPDAADPRPDAVDEGAVEP